ncbi:uncharacterized protein [Diadema antillarum]|uniref:uncharacterized protein n=1 Tax=Diadema antillarum TaxID=105358 RepID=UPI003A86C832
MARKGTPKTGVLESCMSAVNHHEQHWFGKVWIPIFERSCLGVPAVLTGVIMLVMNIALLRIAGRHARRIDVIHVVSSSYAVDGNRERILLDAQQRRHNRRRRWRLSTKGIPTLLLLTSSFCVCWALLWKYCRLSLLVSNNSNYVPAMLARLVPQKTTVVCRLGAWMCVLIYTDDSTQARGTLHDDHGGSSYSGDECDFPAAAAGYAPAELTGRPVQVPSFAAKFAVSACVGDPINDELANSTNYLISHCLEEKSMEESAANYPAPSNCPNLLVPKVNPVIWDNVTQTTRSRDVKLQRVQKSLTRGLCAFLQTLPTDLNEAQQDALALLCNANYEMNCLRKELIKPDMNAAYAHLCKPTTPVTAFLFGDDLGQRVKDLKEENRAAFSVVKGQAKRSTHQPYHPYKRTASGGFSRKQYRNAGWLAAGDTSRPFLGQQQRGYRHSAPHTQTRPPPAHAHNREQSYSTATPAKPNTP